MASVCSLQIYRMLLRLQADRCLDGSKLALYVRGLKGLIRLNCVASQKGKKAPIHTWRHARETAEGHAMRNTIGVRIHRE